MWCSRLCWRTRTFWYSPLALGPSSHNRNSHTLWVPRVTWRSLTSRGPSRSMALSYFDGSITPSMWLDCSLLTSGSFEDCGALNDFNSLGLLGTLYNLGSLTRWGYAPTLGSDRAIWNSLLVGLTLHLGNTRKEWLAPVPMAHSQLKVRSCTMDHSNKMELSQRTGRSRSYWHAHLA